jgi:hypothetical protein
MLVALKTLIKAARNSGVIKLSLIEVLSLFLFAVDRRYRLSAGELLLLPYEKS